MNRAVKTGVLLGALVLGSVAVAQTNADPQQDNSPAPAYGLAAPSIMSAENPPVSSLDEASLEPNLRPRSMLVGGVVASESIDTNVSQQLTTNIDAHSVTRLLGGLTAKRIWSRYDVDAAYVGGAGFYSSVSPLVRNIQEVQVQPSVSWKTGRATLLDSFSYLPEGSFGSGSFGGATGYQPGLGGLGDIGGLPGLGGGHYGVSGSLQYGTLGDTPRLTNVALVSVIQELSPRSAATVAGSFGLVHFTDNGPVLAGGNATLINSNQFGGEAGYSYAINHRDQLGVVYGYSAFRYPADVGADNIDAHIIQALYAHRISGKMDLVLGAGPQWIILKGTDINTGLPSSSTRLAGSGRASLRYSLDRTAISLSYRRFDTTGSGFFAGAESDVARAAASRQIARRWQGKIDVGFSHNSKLQETFSSKGVQAGSFDYVFAGAGVSREFSRNIGAFISYQYNVQVFNDLNCLPGTSCNNQSTRQVVTFGVGWHFQPIRLD
jgi:hypothetical protein